MMKNLSKQKKFQVSIIFSKDKHSYKQIYIDLNNNTISQAKNFKVLFIHSRLIDNDLYEIAQNKL